MSALYYLFFATNAVLIDITCRFIYAEPPVPGLDKHFSSSTGSRLGA